MRGIAAVLHQPLELELRTAGTDRDDAGEVELVTTTRRTVGAVQQLGTSERSERGTIVGEDWRLFLHPSETGVDALAGVTILSTGLSFAVNGTPWLAVNERTARPSHIEARLERKV